MLTSASTGSVKAALQSPRAARVAATRLVFAASVVRDQTQIYSIDPGGGKRAQLTFGNEPASAPLPSPDGRHVLFQRAGVIWVMQANGVGQRMLVARGDEPAWAPDSHRIAYVDRNSKNDGHNATLVLDADGRLLLSSPVSTSAPQLAGSELVVLVPGALRDYDATTGVLLHSWPMPDVSFAGVCGVPLWQCGAPHLRLEGAAKGLVAYLLDGKLHLLRLRDRADTTVSYATRAALDDNGLFYSYTTNGLWRGRIRFVPFDQLPIR